MAEIKIDNKEVNKALKKVEKKIKNPAALFQGVQARMMKDVDDHFQFERSPTRQWKALNPKTLKARRKGKGIGRSGGILKDTGRLRSSIQGGANSVNKRTKKSATIGTNLKYANIHNFGGVAGRNLSAKIPQREYMWLSNKAEKDILKLLWMGIEKAWR